MRKIFFASIPLVFMNFFVTQSAIAFDHYKISFQTFSLNPKIIDFQDVKMGYKVEFTYFFNQLVYLKLNTVDYSGKLGVGSKIGLQYTINKFKPYVELGYDDKPKSNIWIIQNSYDVGLSYRLFSHVSPFVELDNFATYNRQSVKMGSDFPISASLSVTVDYIQGLAKTPANGVELKLNYLF